MGHVSLVKDYILSEVPNVLYRAHKTFSTGVQNCMWGPEYISGTEHLVLEIRIDAIPDNRNAYHVFMYLYRL